MQLLYAIDLGRLGETQAQAADPPPHRDEAGAEAARRPVAAPDHGLLLEAIDAEFNADGNVRDAAAKLAIEAWRTREKADAICAELAPDWPPHRQPPVDRAILRLAICEIATGRTPMRVAINEAVELAKHYAGEESPMFINAVLDKAAARLPAPPAPAEAEADPGDADAPGPAPRVDPDRWLDDALHATS